MGPHVSLEVTILSTGEVALFANKRLLSTVNQHVSFQMRNVDAFVATLIATVLRHARF